MSPPLFEIVDFLSRESSHITPDFLEQRPMIKNCLYGYLGTIGATQLVQYGISKAFPKFYDKHFPTIERIVGYGLLATPFIYGIIDNQSLQENIVSMHPVYSAGMLGALAGTIKTLMWDAQADRPNVLRDLEVLIHNRVKTEGKSKDTR